MHIQKILAVRNDRFGEFLLTIPALKELKQHYPGAQLTLAVNRPVLELAERIPFLDEVAVWENKKHGLPEILKFAKEAAKQKYDLCVIFNPSKELNLASFLARIPVRCGYDRKWGFLLNRRLKDRKYQGFSHEMDYNLELLRIIGINAANSACTISLDIREEDFSDKRVKELGLYGKHFIVIHPWASNKQKEWPQDKFKAVALQISSNLRLPCVIIGGLEEAQRADEFCHGLPLINLTGKTTLIELAALLKKSRIIITNDSGPMHLAAVQGVPVVAIFRKNPPAVSPRRWGPVGDNHIIIENNTLNNISVEEVLDGVKTILAR